MQRRIHLLVLIAMLFGSTLLGASAQDVTPGGTPAGGDSLLADLGYPEIRVATDGTTNDFPTELDAGRYRVVLDNRSNMEINLEVLQLPAGVTADEMTAAFEEAEAAAPPFVPPDLFFDTVFNGGPSAPAGETSEVVLDLTPGEWTVNLYAYDPATDEDTNTPTTVTVSGEMPDLDDPAGREISMIDMEFVMPDSLEAGPQVWHVVNNGLQVHHLVLDRVPEGTTEEQVIELVSTLFAPPATPLAGATPAEPGLAFEDVEDVFSTLPLSRGQFNLYEIDLELGTYAMICFMPDPSGTPHVMLGMVEIVVVA